MIEGDKEELRSLRRKQLRTHGPGVRHGRDNIYISSPRPRPARRVAPEETPDLHVIPTGQETGVGMYFGHVCTMRTVPIDPATDVTLAAIGSADMSEEILIVNMKEIANTSGVAWIAADGTRAYPAQWAEAPADEDSPRRVAYINELDPEVCTPP